jgi:two-component system, NarL family, response regulator FusR
MAIHILIVDDHPHVLSGLAQLLNQNPDMQVCCGAHNPQQALMSMRDCRHDLAIIDISLGDASGLDLVKTLKLRYPGLAMLVMSMHDESLYAERAIRLGAKGYIMKSQVIDQIENAIRTIMDGHLYLSDVMKAQRFAASVESDVAASANAGMFGLPGDS